MPGSPSPRVPGAVTTRLAPAGVTTDVSATAWHMVLGILLIMTVPTGAVLLVRAHPEWFRAAAEEQLP